MSWMMLGFQDPSTNNALLMMHVYHTVMQMMMIIIIMIMYLMTSIMMNKSINLNYVSNNNMEILWTVIPMGILIYMAIPSIQLLYMIETPNIASITIKVIGHQWFWSYEYPEFNASFDSYMTLTQNNNFRLLDVDTRMICPTMPTRILCTSTDVIHSWAIPSMGMKMDAIPGRMNQMILTPMMTGVYYGQCSEICGMNHSFMPVVVEAVTPNLFIKWIKSM